MADVSYSKKATERKATSGIIAGKGDANNLKVLGVASIEVPPSASGTTIKFCRIPANARLSNRSRIYWDSLSTSGAPTLAVGLGSVDSNITSDYDALTTGLTLATADAEGAPLLADVADVGLPAWQIAGASSDPGGELDVYGTIKAAATLTTTATLSVEVFGYLD